MNLSAVILVILQMFLVVVYSDENTRDISSVLELFPEFVQMNDKINKLEKELFPEFVQMKNMIKKLEKGWVLPHKTHLKNYRVKSEHIESTVFSSGLECWIKCTETIGCTSASFQSEGGKCELSRVPYFSYDILEKAVGWDVFTMHSPVVSLHDRNYSLSLAAAKAYCVSLGLSIATLEDLNAAYDNGYQKCSCGWAANGVAYLVMQVAESGCLSSVGVLQCNWRSTSNVYCKPLKSSWALPYKTRLRNYRVKSEHIESTVFSSGLECWIKCTDTNGCTSISFQLEGGKCELSRVPHISYDVLEKAVGWDAFTKHYPVVSLHDHNYSLSLAGAKAYCASLGLSIATLEDLNAAYDNGYQKCNCGWAANGVAYLVMQVADSGCLSYVGVLQCSWRSTWNVYCKPLKSSWALPYKTRLRNYRVKSDHIESTVFSSGLECWIKCTETNGCTSISFQLEGGKCELSRVPHISYDVLEKAVGWDAFTKHSPVVSLHDHSYSLDLAGAKAYCASLGLSIATLEDLNAAYDNGYQKCNCGWAANGVAYLIMQVADSGCLSSVGVLKCNWRSTWNVYCKLLISD